jgi:hypothetical protein
MEEEDLSKEETEEEHLEREEMEEGIEPKGEDEGKSRDKVMEEKRR